MMRQIRLKAKLSSGSTLQWDWFTNFLFMAFFILQENKAASIELTQICNCSICKIKLIHNKAISSINCLQILRQISRCPQANAYRTPLYENSEVGLDFPEDREHFLCTQYTVRDLMQILDSKFLRKELLTFYSTLQEVFLSFLINT